MHIIPPRDNIGRGGFDISFGALAGRRGLRAATGDWQLYVSFAAGDSVAALNGLQSCLATVQSWMSTIKLKLDPDKTEFLLIGNERQQCKFLSMFPIALLASKLTLQNLLRILQ